MTTIAAASLILTGMILMGIIVWFTMPSLMLVKSRSELKADIAAQRRTEPKAISEKCLTAKADNRMVEDI